MELREHIPLTTLTTLRVGGVARFVADCASIIDIREAIAFARERDLPHAVLGGGSNVVAEDAGFAGVLLRIAIPGIEYGDADPDGIVRVTAGAGVSWDELVASAVSRDLWGLENLAGIPGTVGAAPVQNIGAYGAELANTLVYVDALDTRADTTVRIMNEDCAFGYRESRFKSEPHLIITHVAFALSAQGTPAVAYKDLALLADSGVALDTPEAIAAAVRQVRARKFPDLALYGTAGSFFKNPVITADAYNVLTERYGDVPSYSAPRGDASPEEVKIPLAFILDHILGLKGHQSGHVSLFANQPLVLVTDGEATAREVDAFADDIATRVFDATGIAIEREARAFPNA